MYTEDIIEKKKLTYEDYAALDDGILYELINGELFMSPAPTFFHQRASSELFYILTNFIKLNELGIVISAPIDVIIDKYNTVQPDIVFISNQNKKHIEERGIVGPPDMVIEFVSPSTYYRDTVEKKELYEKFGINEFWLVDINNKVIEVFELKDGKYQLFSFIAGQGSVKSKLLKGFEAKVEEIVLDKIE